MCEQCVAKVHTLTHHGAYLFSVGVHTLLALEENSQETDDLILEVADLQRESMEKMVEILDRQLDDYGVGDGARSKWHPTKEQREVLKLLLSEFTGLSLVDRQDWDAAAEEATIRRTIESIIKGLDIEPNSVEEVLGGHDPETMH